MPTNLTGSSVASTYDQLLHVDGGPAATEKIVYSGTGVPTALKVGTGSVSVDNLKLDGNTISSTNANGNITLSPDGTGTVAFSKAAITGGTISGVGISSLTGALAIADGGTGATTDSGARTNLGLGTIATQNANAVAVTGGTLSGVGVSSLTAPLAVADGGTGATTDSVARTNLGIGSNGTFNKAYGYFYSDTDQTYSANTPAVVTFNQSAPFNTGVSVVSTSQITMAAAGVYKVGFTGQLYNADSSDHDVTIWFRLNGTDIVGSATKLTVPKLADGGVTVFTISGMAEFTAGQYIEAVVMVEDADVKLDATAAAVGPPAVPSIPSAIIHAERIG